MERVVDKQRTKDARARHTAGVKQIDALCNVPAFLLPFRGLHITHSRTGYALTGPPRVRKNCPPLRDPATKARHLARKRARAARRRNRP